MNELRVRKAIHLAGVVQGVGFRPTVYRLALSHDLSGWVRNRSDGLEIEIEGGGEHVQAFIRDLTAKGPPFADVSSVAVSDRETQNVAGFRILGSFHAPGQRTLCPADLATCSDCIRELFDPADRRYRYPFINCTNCGPRFTLVGRMPYDRATTSMSCFPLCDACQDEYDNPLDRRYHAQPNACPVCGPKTWLVSKTGSPLACEDPLQHVANEVRSGKIVALKGVGGFHLAADATDSAVVQRLRELKGRSTKPFAVMVADLGWAEECARLDDECQRLLCSAANPIVLAPWNRVGSLVEEVAPGLDMVGLFLPYTPIHHLLFRMEDDKESLPPLIMTSGNAADEPIVTGNREALRRLAHYADLFLFHNRDVLSRADDSVVQRRRGHTVFIRRSRGYVPRPIRMPEGFPAVLGTGAFLKATPCVLQGNEAFLGQHVGDLSTVESIVFHQNVIQSICELTGIEPTLVGCDLNPDFPSSRWAMEKSGLPVEQVQHHHAHVNAAALSLGMTPPILGLAVDGTGLGLDGAIWGCELLWAEKRDFVRLGHLRYAPLPGGDAAVDEPWRSAIGFLLMTYGDDTDEIISRVLPGVPKAEKHRILEMARQSVNTPFHSSCGRLFDAVAALAGVCTHATHEAQAPMALESAILGSDKGNNHGRTSLRLKLVEENGVAVLDPSLLLRTVTETFIDSGNAAEIAIRFHESLVLGLADLVEWGARKVNANTVILTGGCMLNRYLSRRLLDELQRRRLQGTIPSAISPGDGGSSIGQAAIAAWRHSGK